MNRSLAWVVGFCGLVAVSCGARDSNGVEADASASRPSYVPTAEQQVRAAYVSARQAEGAIDPLYAFHQTGTAIETVHPESQMRAKVDAEGLTLSKAGEPWSASFHTSTIGCQQSPSAAPAPSSSPTFVGEGKSNHVQIDRSAASHDQRVTEWYTHGPFGLEQGWTLQDNPCATGQLEIRLNVAGLAVANGKSGVELRDESGGTKINYTDAWSRDAKGRSLETTMSASNGSIAIHVDTRGATFPVEVDPLAWFQQQELTASDGAANDQFGYSVAVSGGTAVIGAQYKAVGANALQGAAYVFVKNGSNWTEQQGLTASDGAANDRFGYSVAVSGGTAVVGAYSKQIGANSNQGAAYVFVQNGTTWTQQQRLTASDGAASENFGYSVAVSGGTAVVGAWYKQIGANSNQGAAYVFVQNGSNWTEQQRLTANDGVAYDVFGCSVAVSGGTALVGAYGRAFGANYSQGTAYIFVQNGTTWTQQQRLNASDGATSDSFGSSVAVSGGTAVIGAHGKTVGANSSGGAAYVFVQSGTTWTEQQRLTPSDGASGDAFGVSVAVSGSTVVVGANIKTVGANALQGVAYVFAQSGTTWTEQQRLTAADGATQDQFGFSVAIAGGTAVVGAVHKAVGSNQTQGASFVFNLGPTNGTSCTKASDCGSGFCVDAFCCDTACGLCQACAAVLKQSGKDDGVCGPVLTGTNPHKDACPVDLPATCGHDGLCDGVGACRIHPPSGTFCTSTCSVDQETDSACDGSGKCLPGGPKTCGSYLCDATKCKSSCALDTDCNKGLACRGGKCVPPTAKCTGPSESTGVDGVVAQCAPFRCDTSGACKVVCISVDDCVAPTTCDPSGKCVRPAASTAAGCSTSGGTGAASGFAMWLVMGVIARRRRRSRGQCVRIRRTQRTQRMRRLD